MSTTPRIETSFVSEGERCDAWWFPQRRGSGAPGVVMAHGFGCVRGAGLEPTARFFADAGLGVLLLDYRHHGTSEGRPRGLIDPGRQQADYRSAVVHLHELAGVGPERTVLWGTSFSAGHVVTLAAEEPRLAAAIVQNPYVDGPAALHHARRTTGAGTAARLAGAWLRDEVGRLAGRPPHRVPLVGPPGATAVFTAAGAEEGYRALLPTAPEERDRIGWESAVPARVLVRLLRDRPARHADRIRCPLLVGACRRDGIAPVGPAVRLSRAAPRGELVLYDADHFDVFAPPLRTRVLADQVAFLRRVVPSW